MHTGLESIASWPGKVHAAGWVRRDGTQEVTGEHALELPLASVTKLLTATAVLVAVEEEVIELDEAAGPAGSTVRHLLAHASGMPFDGAGSVGEPGRRRVYGNPAYELLGELLEERAGIVFADYVQESVCLPLGMHHTSVHGSPAHSGRSTVDDLLRFAHELLHPGSVLAHDTVAEATTTQFPDLSGVLPGFGRHDPNPWGLGFELHGDKSPHWMPKEASPETFGHFGQSGSFLWIDPVAGVACAALGDADFGDWALDAWPALGRDVLDAAHG